MHDSRRRDGPVHSEPQERPGSVRGEADPAQRSLRSSLPALLAILSGAAAILLAFLVDLVRGEIGGQFGGKQITLLLLGAFLVGWGVLLTLPAFRVRLARVRARAREDAPGALALISERPGLYIAVGASFGLGTGLVEALWILYMARVEFYTRFTDLSAHVVWMAPVSYLALFGGIGVVVFALARFAAFQPRPNAVLALFTFLSSLALLQTIRGLHDWAVLILAAGIASQVGPALGRYLRPVLTASVRLTPVLALITLGLFANLTGGDRLRQFAALEGTDPADGPNVLLVILDTVRAKSLSLYGYERATTPSLQRFGRTGVVFERAFSTSPWTLPSHATMFTGQLPHRLSTAWLSPLDDTHPTLAEFLSARGYETAGFVANFAYCTAEHGLARGFQHYEDRRVNVAETIASASLGRWAMSVLRVAERWGTHDNLRTKSADQLNRDFLDWLDRRRDGRPFFAFLNYFDAHDPYLSPSPFMRRFSEDRNPKARLVHSELDALTESDIEELTDAYDGAIAYLDDRIGSLLETLEQRGMLDNTIVVITSDHGEQLGEHNIMFHSNSLYLPTLHVPLIVSAPTRVPAGRRVTTDVSLRDLAATIVDLTGLAAESPFPGRTLARTWGGPSQPAPGARGPEEDAIIAEIDRSQPIYPPWYPAMKGRMRSAIAEGMHYIVNYGDGQEELYDLNSDFDELYDLSGDPRARGHLDRLRAAVEGIERDR